MLRDLARRRRRDLDRRLVGLDLDERLVLRHLVPLGDEPAGDLAFGQALAEIRKLELVRHGGGIYRGRPIQASAGTISTRRPPSVRQIETACSSPAKRRRVLPRHVAELERPLLVPDPDRVRIVLVLRLGDERELPARIEGRIGERLGTERDSGHRHDEDARVLPANDLAGRGVTEPVARPGALEQQPQPLVDAIARS